VLVNHAAQTERARAVAAQLLGADNVVTRGPVMGSEDFAYMLEHRPGAYVRLGNGLGQDGGCMVHNPLYDFNDKALPIGAAFWASSWPASVSSTSRVVRSSSRTWSWPSSSTIARLTADWVRPSVWPVWLKLRHWATRRNTWSWRRLTCMVGHETEIYDFKSSINLIN